MILLDVTIVNVALPSIQQELDVLPSSLEWVVGAYTLVLATLILVGGSLGDRFGRKRVFLAGLSIFTLASAGCALSTDDRELIAFRALQGVGGAAMAALTLSILIHAYPPERRTSAVGTWAAIGGLGFGLGPVIGGLLIRAFDWSAIFWVNVPIGLICGAVTLVAVQDSRDPQARRLDVRGAVLAATGLFLLTFALIESNRRSWTSPIIVGSLAGAVVMLGAFAAWERRAESPMLPPALLRNRRFVAANTVFALMYFSLAGMLFFLTLYFQDLRGWSALETGVSWLLLNVPFMAASTSAGRLARSYDARLLIGGGSLLAGVGMLLVALLSRDSGFWLAGTGYVLMGLGYGTAAPLVSSHVMGDVPAGLAGTGSGVLNSARQMGASVGIAVMGAIGVAIATHVWDSKTATLPLAVQADARSLGQQVAGGQTRQIVGRLGAVAQQSAIDSFLTGYHWAMAAGTVALAAAGMTALIGLRPRKPARTPVSRRSGALLPEEG
jgi:EmrB/QacA subfamily drug resistance transporter